MEYSNKPEYTLPTMDISPLREVCLANTGLTLPARFVDDVKTFEKNENIDWIHSKFAHREYKENRGYGDPNGIESIDIDHRIIVRQLKSTIQQEIELAFCGDINTNTDIVSESLRQALGWRSKYFSDLMLLKFNSNQGFLPHKDGSGFARLYIPIYPFGQDYSRLEFYWENQIYYLYNYISPPPVYLFSSKVIHSVFNQGYPTRLNLQVTSTLPYEEAIELFNES